MEDAISLVLRTAYRHAVREPTAEAGFARIREITGTTLSDAVLADAVARCVAAGHLKDPVRLEEGALQCRWQLDLTPAGVQAALDLR